MYCLIASIGVKLHIKLAAPQDPWLLFAHLGLLKMFSFPVVTPRRFNVYTTSPTSYRRLKDVETTSYLLGFLYIIIDTLPLNLYENLIGCLFFWMCSRMVVQLGRFYDLSFVWAIYIRANFKHERTLGCVIVLGKYPSTCKYDFLVCNNSTFYSLEMPLLVILRLFMSSQNKAQYFCQKKLFWILTWGNICCWIIWNFTSCQKIIGYPDNIYKIWTR